MSDATESAAVRVPREVFEEALREGLSLARESCTTPEGKPYSSYPVAESTRCAMSVLIDNLRAIGWTIEPPRLKARPKAIKKLKGGIGPIDLPPDSA